MLEIFLLLPAEQWSNRRCFIHSQLDLRLDIRRGSRVASRSTIRHEDAPVMLHMDAPWESFINLAWGFFLIDTDVLASGNPFARVTTRVYRLRSGQSRGTMLRSHPNVISDLYS